MKTTSRLFFASCVMLCLIILLWNVSAPRVPASAQAAAAQAAAAPAEPNSSAPLPARPAIPMVLSTRLPQPESMAGQILRLLASDNPADQTKVYKDLLPAWVRRDPRAAAAFAQSSEAAKWRNDLMVTVAQTWTDVNVNDAENWASQLSNPTERSMVLGYVSFAEAGTDPSRAVQVLQNPALSDDRRTIIVANLAQQWAAQDLQPLYDWISTLPAGDQRDSLYSRVARAQSQSSPEKAVQIVTDNIAPGPAQDSAALYILRQWARQDMASAATWVEEFPPGELHDKAVQVLQGNLVGAYSSF